MKDEQKLQKYQEFAENIPMNELFSHIKKITGLSDLVFTSKIVEDRYGYPRIIFESQDIVDKVGFLKLIFKELKIANFNSNIVYKDETDTFLYWCTVAMDYTHPGGGSNGKTFLHARYINGTWEFEYEE